MLGRGGNDRGGWRQCVTVFLCHISMRQFNGAQLVCKVADEMGEQVHNHVNFGP
jgi:hypothetical protein